MTPLVLSLFIALAFIARWWPSDADLNNRLPPPGGLQPPPAGAADVVAAPSKAAATSPTAAPPEVAALGERTYVVERVVDGDTIILTVPQDPRPGEPEHRGRVRVRLIGVDCQELGRDGLPDQPWSREATEFTRQFIAQGSGSVQLTLDRERHDRYGRALAYVWVDGKMLNEELVRAGMAIFKPNFNYSSTIKTRYRRAQEEARQAGRGIWSQ